MKRFINVARVWLSLVSCYPSVTWLLLIVFLAVNDSLATCQRPLNGPLAHAVCDERHMASNERHLAFPERPCMWVG